MDGSVVEEVVDGSVGEVESVEEEAVVEEGVSEVDNVDDDVRSGAVRLP